MSLTLNYKAPIIIIDLFFLSVIVPYQAFGYPLNACIKFFIAFNA